MKPPAGPALASVLLVVGPSMLAGGCAGRTPADGMDEVANGDAETSTGATSVGGEASTTGASEPIDVSRFLGLFHNENRLVPLGDPVDNPGGVALTHVEIRPDGSASMTMETCSDLLGTIEIAWRWEASPGPVLELFPGAGEESLRYMAMTDVESLRLLPVGSCDFQFEIDGAVITAPTETFHPGRACWVTRCEPTWVVEIDYCPGEEPVVCE